MIDSQKVIAVIPARSGSKRAPRKNLREYKGKTLIQWALDAAVGSKYIDYYCVSSDDPAFLPRKAAGLIRPAWLADDGATNEGVLIHTLYTWIWADWVVLLQPTSPLRTAQDIDCTIELAAEDGRGAVSVRKDGTRNGAVYVVKSHYLISRMKLADDTCYVMPDERSLDIDYPDDFIR